MNENILMVIDEINGTNKYWEITYYARGLKNKLFMNGKVVCELIISKVLNKDGTPSGLLTLESDKETIEKAQELIDLFAGVPLENIKTCLLTNEGNLAIEVLTHLVTDGNMKELTPLKMLVDELQEKLAAVAYNKDYVPRGALLRELEDVLKAKTITPYRRQRINRALKRECLRCLGTGKAGKIINDTVDWKKQRKMTVGVSTTDPECPTCKGTGIKPIERNRVTEKEAEIAINNELAMEYNPDPDPDIDKD